MNKTSKLVRETIEDVCKEIFALDDSALNSLLDANNNGEIAEILLYSNALESGIQQSKAYDYCESKDVFSIVGDEIPKIDLFYDKFISLKDNAYEISANINVPLITGTLNPFITSPVQSYSLEFDDFKYDKTILSFTNLSVNSWMLQTANKLTLPIESVEMADKLTLPIGSVGIHKLEPTVQPLAA